MSVVSMEELVLALKNTLGKKGMQENDICRLADYIMSFFGYTDSVIDNRLTSEDRDVFYMLEEEGLVKLEHGRITPLNIQALITYDA